MELFSIYDNLDTLNISILQECAKSTAWPKGKRYTVNCNGVEIKIQTYLVKVEENFPTYGYDAYAAIASMYARELSDDEIRWGNDGGPQYSNPEFNTKVLSQLTDAQLDKRKEFLMAISNLINNQATMDAIVQVAAKKENGTLHKNRVVKIACSGITGFCDRVYAIVGRAKTDTTMSITFEEVLCKPGDNDVWAKDFISTHHEGLPVSEALRLAM